ncbi:MAG: LLM class flavin-dependent oxidoreductase [Ilumatobacter sp.]|nr:LLM class flavin-dependent oxidoreductase [Ilumatobacter sp.]
MRTDVVFNAFGSDLRQLLAIARVVDESGFGALWVNDHFSGAVLDAPWSRDPFVMLGAVAAATERIDVGLLVANMMNRHPAQLASAANSVQSLAPGRVRLGIGSGAAPGSRFAVEHEMIGTPLADSDGRLAMLRRYIADLRAMWKPDGRAPVGGVVDGAPMPQLIVGGSAWPTIEVAIEMADGVNVRRTRRLAEHLAQIGAADVGREFEVSVLDDHLDLDHPTGGAAADLAGVDRRLVTISGDVDLATLRAFGERVRD